MRRHSLQPTPEPPHPTPHLALLESMATLAEKRAQLLLDEAKVWSEVARAIGDFAKSAASASFALNAAPVTAEGERKHLLNVTEAARFLRLSDTTLNNWRLVGGGPEFVRLGRRIFYRLDVLEGFLRKQSVPHTSAYPPEK